ncbi:uncharacterized protein LOC133728251 [Rosa rugosa]|uniref:uncharacterized protein LOC133728251 n=1 Tax=Rosa rugosa TaxID=74645 RepID=UPI002B4164DB|nr:uncharacterized protein LOC133728251 [Rosa rugosa]
MRQVCLTINSMSKFLQSWQYGVFRHRRDEIQEVQQRLHALLSAPFFVTQVEEKIVLTARFHELQTLEDTGDPRRYWRQRSKVDWLRDGDRDTAYFHHRASNRRHYNAITGLHNEDGQWVTSSYELE